MQINYITALPSIRKYARVSGTFSRFEKDVAGKHPLVVFVGQFLWRPSFPVLSAIDCITMPVLSHAMQAKVLYDFEGLRDNGELTIREGQIITILNQVSPFS